MRVAAPVTHRHPFGQYAREPIVETLFVVLLRHPGMGLAQKWLAVSRASLSRRI
jgi:hypothetical protein